MPSRYLSSNPEEMANTAGVYSTLEEAIIELERRRQDETLKQRIEAFLQDHIDITAHFKDAPRFVYSRDIISPNHEFFAFINLIKDKKYLPLYFEYKCGKLVTKNFNKYHISKLHFHDSLNDQNVYDHSNKTKLIVDFNTQQGKKMSHVETHSGDSLVNFHRKILQQTAGIPVEEDHFLDISEWFNTCRHDSPWYYVLYLTLFIYHGILFDNFISGKGEGVMIREKMLPSFDAVADLFGVKPLVVAIVPVEVEENDFWWYYPSHIKDI